MHYVPFKPCIPLKLLTTFLIWVALEANVLAVTPQSKPWLRANDSLGSMRTDPKGRYIAFVGAGGKRLSVINIQTKDIYLVTEQQVGNSFFWSPDGYRLFYRELVRNQTLNANSGAVASNTRVPSLTSDALPEESTELATNEQVISRIKAYDCVLKQSVQLEEIPARSGALSFDPRDLRMQLLSPLGISSKRLHFPDQSLARWQSAQRTERGKWLATQNGMLWLTEGGHAMQRMDDDGSNLQSFAISPDGAWVAWATGLGRVYASDDGKKPIFVGFGRDPAWHPKETKLLYAGARMVGNKAVSYDLRLSDLRGAGKFLTTTQALDERWPQFFSTDRKSGTYKIIYTLDRTTDIYMLDLKK